MKTTSYYPAIMAAEISATAEFYRRHFRFAEWRSDRRHQADPAEREICGGLSDGLTFLGGMDAP
jgi:hypothetical protein